MKFFADLLRIQLKIDLRERGSLLNFYAVPILFYLVAGSVFSAINPEMRNTLAAVMTIFGITMGAILGLPGPLVELRTNGTFRALTVNGISPAAVSLVHAVSALIHLFLVSCFICLTAPFLFASGTPASQLHFAGILLLLCFTSTAIGTLIGLAAENQSAATMLSQIIFLPSLLLSGIMFPASMLPAPLRIAGRILPATNAMQLFRTFAYKSATDESPAAAFILLAAAGTAAAAVCMVKVQTGSGKEPAGVSIR